MFNHHGLLIHVCYDSSSPIAGSNGNVTKGGRIKNLAALHAATSSRRRPS